MISAVLLTKNEEENLKKCLTGLTWCDEIIVIDDNSTDKTIEIAKTFKAKFYKRALNNNFASQRNFGLSKSKGDWVLFIDADEVVSKELAQEIKKVILKNSAEGYLIKRVGVYDEWIIRLAKKTAGKWRREVHEKWEVNGKVGKLSSTLLHSPSKSLAKFVEKINFYSTIHAKSNKNEGKNVNLIKIVFWPIFKFIYNFLIKGGYKDGVRGFVFAVFMSFHSYLSWSKQWELQRTK